MYRLADVAKAIAPERSVALLVDLRNWFGRDVLRYSPAPGEGVEADQPPPKPGSPAFLSRHRVIQVALTTHLVALGLSPREAADAAATFSDFSTPPRLPGLPFPSGDTILVVWRDAGGELRRRVVNPGPRDTNVRFLLGTGLPLPAAILTVDCGQVLRDLEALIGPSPAYPA